VKSKGSCSLRSSRAWKLGGVCIELSGEGFLEGEMKS
jgi:hypothetical protein